MIVKHESRIRTLENKNRELEMKRDGNNGNNNDQQQQHGGGSAGEEMDPDEV